MPKGYFLSAHRSPADPEKRAAYLEFAGPALVKAGGKVLANTSDIVAHEKGISQQTVLIEFETFEKAVAAYESEDYQKALKALANKDNLLNVFFLISSKSIGFILSYFVNIS